MLTRPGPWCGVGTSPAMLTRCRLGAHLLGSALAPLLGPARPSPSGAGWGALRCSLAVASLGAHLLGSALAPLIGPARPSASGAGWGALRCSLAVASVLICSAPRSLRSSGPLGPVLGVGLAQP